MSSTHCRSANEACRLAGHGGQRDRHDGHVDEQHERSQADRHEGPPFAHRDSFPRAPTMRHGRRSGTATAPGTALSDTDMLSRWNPSRLDDVDRSLVHALQVDGRAPFGRIAEVLGVSDQTIARRYRRLRSAGALRVVGSVDARRLGYASWAIRLRCAPTPPARSPPRSPGGRTPSGCTCCPAAPRSPAAPWRAPRRNATRCCCSGCRVRPGWSRSPPTRCFTCTSAAG